MLIISKNVSVALRAQLLKGILKRLTQIWAFAKLCAIYICNYLICLHENFTECICILNLFYISPIKIFYAYINSKLFW